MKIMAYIIIGVFILVSLEAFYVFRPATNTTTKTQEKKEIQRDTWQQQDNPFEELRNIALNATADQLGLQITEDLTKVYGIVMDWDIGNGVVTTVSYETGDASMYLSSGGGVIGGGQHDNVRAVVGPYIKLGQGYLGKATKTETTPLPDKNCVRFYLLTNRGIYYAQEEMVNIENETSYWLPVFVEANKVLTELRLTSEER
jgi:hypothetical protein